MQCGPKTLSRAWVVTILIVLPDLNQLSDAEIVAENPRALRLPRVLGDRELFIGASIGITGYPTDGEDPDILCAMPMRPCTAPRKWVATLPASSRRR